MAAAGSLASGAAAPRPARKLAPLAGANPNSAAAGAAAGLGQASDISSLRVVFPGHGANFTLRHADALFGPTVSVGQGASVAGLLYYPPSSPTGCDSFTAPPGTVVLMDRGNCSFTAKVLHAQQAGAAGALVTDSAWLCGLDSQCSSTSAQCRGCPYYEVSTDCECSLRMMADDGLGTSVQIPSFMIGRTDGTLLKQAAGGIPGQSALAVLAWDLPNPSGQVELSVWLTADDKNAYAWRQGFEPYLPYFGGKLQFKPRFYIFDGRSLGCTTDFDCGNQCTGYPNAAAAYYCNLDPDGDMDKGVSGADVVAENLRQLCLWQQIQVAQAQGASDPLGARWWAYADAFSSICAASPGTFTQACSEAQAAGQGFDLNALRSCVAAAGPVNPTGGDYTMPLLEGELQDREDMAIVTLPTAVVGDTILRGSMTAANVLASVCASFAAGTAPVVCACQSVPVQQLAACVAAGGASTSGTTVVTEAGGFPGWATTLIVLLCLGLTATVGAVWWLQRRNRSQMAEILEDYRQLMDVGGGAAGGAGAAGAAGGYEGEESEGAGLVGGRKAGGGEKGVAARLASRLGQLRASVGGAMTVPQAGGAHAAGEGQLPPGSSF